MAEIARAKVELVAATIDGALALCKGADVIAVCPTLAGMIDDSCLAALVPA